MTRCCWDNSLLISSLIFSNMLSLMSPTPSFAKYISVFPTQILYVTRAATLCLLYPASCACCYLSTHTSWCRYLECFAAPGLICVSTFQILLTGALCSIQAGLNWDSKHSGGRIKIIVTFVIIFPQFALRSLLGWNSTVNWLRDHMQSNIKLWLRLTILVIDYYCCAWWTWQF